MGGFVMKKMFGKKDKKDKKAKAAKAAFVISAPPDVEPDETPILDPVTEFLVSEKVFAESMKVFLESVQGFRILNAIPSETWLEYTEEDIYKATDAWKDFIRLSQVLVEKHQKFLELYEATGFSKETIDFFEKEYSPVLRDAAIVSNTAILDGKIDAILRKTQINERIARYEEQYVQNNSKYSPLKELNSFTIKPMQQITRYPLKMKEINKDFERSMDEFEQGSSSLAGNELMRERRRMVDLGISYRAMFNAAGKMAVEANEKMREAEAKAEGKKAGHKGPLTESEELSAKTSQELSKSVRFFQQSSEKLKSIKKSKERDKEKEKEPTAEGEKEVYEKEKYTFRESDVRKRRESRSPPKGSPPDVESPLKEPTSSSKKSLLLSGVFLPLRQPSTPDLANEKKGSKKGSFKEHSPEKDKISPDKGSKKKKGA